MKIHFFFQGLIKGHCWRHTSNKVVIEIEDPIIQKGAEYHVTVKNQTTFLTLDPLIVVGMHMLRRFHIQFSQTRKRWMIVVDSFLMSPIPMGYYISLYGTSTLISIFLCLAVRHLFGVLSNSFYVIKACYLHMNQSSTIIVLFKHSICLSND